MALNIYNLQIESDSKEGVVLQAIIDRDHVSPEEAIRRALREAPIEEVSPAEEMWGAFSKDEDLAVLKDAMSLVYDRRSQDQRRDLTV